MIKAVFDKKCKRCEAKIPSTKRKDSLYCSAKCGELYRTAKHYYNNPALYKAKRLLNNKDVPKRILTRVKSRAKSYNIPFNLELEDILVPEICPVLGIPITSKPGGGANQPGSPSLDRVNPSKGYIKGNVRVISNRANLLKSNATLEEMLLILEDLRCLSKRL